MAKNQCTRCGKYLVGYDRLDGNGFCLTCHSEVESQEPQIKDTIIAESKRRNSGEMPDNTDSNEGKPNAFGAIFQFVLALLTTFVIGSILFASNVWYLFLGGINFNFFPIFYALFDVIVSVIIYKFLRANVLATTFLILNLLLAFLFYITFEIAMGV